jgi:hypothetical protein
MNPNKHKSKIVNKPGDARNFSQLLCSPLGELGAKRLEDILDYLPHLEKEIYKAAVLADDVGDLEDYKIPVIEINTSNAYWILDLMAFVKTLPKYLAENGKDQLPPTGGVDPEKGVDGG